MNPNNNFSNNNKNNNKMPKFNMGWIYGLCIIGLIIAFIMGGNSTGGSAGKQLAYSDFQTYVAKGYAESIVVNKDNGKLKMFVKPNYIRTVFNAGTKQMGPNPFVEVQYGSVDKLEGFIDAARAQGVFKGGLSYESDQGSILMYILQAVGPIILFFAIWIFLMRRMGGGGGPGILGVGKSKAKVYDKEKNENPITFKDVAGQEGAKQEVQEIVDFLKNPKKYTDLGAKIPKGALLVGPPGNGKTLLAKAVAGEANVPFFSMSGSDFVEMFVGVGASRVRDLFAQAKEKAPCIVFIDEIDAVGRARGKNAGFSGNDERENTLNQLLTEMDGFGSNSGVIVLAATNRADILDKALMRAGRFDRQIHVDLPELKEREEIFKVHIRDLKISKDFDVSYMAKHTAGFSGADIANVCNEAALGAARKNKSEIDLQDFLDAVDRIVGGIVKKGYLLSDSEKKTIAHHEAGHAVVSWLLPHANQLFKVTLVPRGNALGAAWYLPDEHKIERKSQMIDEMCSLIGGRVAEEILNGEPSTGAQNDLERLTKTAYSMIQNYGMSEVFGNFSFYDSTGSRAYDFTRPYSEKTAELLDAEVSKLVKEVHDKTYKILKDHEQEWREVANELLTKEVIFADDVQAILGPKVKDAQDELKEQDDTVSQA